jgi:predicted transport protein
MNENSQETVQSLQDRLDYEQSVKEIMNRIHSAKEINEILIDLKDDVLGLFGAERITIYAIDRKNQEIFSKFIEVDETKEIRVPINDKSISGYVANHKQLLNIVDVYDKNMLRNINIDLSFDNTWDEKTGFRSKQALCVPIVYERMEKTSTNMTRKMLRRLPEQSASPFITSTFYQ